MEVAGLLLWTFMIGLTFAAVLVGIGYGLWLLISGRGLLSAASFLGAALVVYAYYNRAVDVQAGVGSAVHGPFAARSLAGCVLVGVALWVGLVRRLRRPDQAQPISV